MKANQGGKAKSFLSKHSGIAVNLAVSSCLSWITVVSKQIVYSNVKIKYPPVFLDWDMSCREGKQRILKMTSGKKYIFSIYKTELKSILPSASPNAQIKINSRKGLGESWNIYLTHSNFLSYRDIPRHTMTFKHWIVSKSKELWGFSAVVIYF